MLVKPHVWLRLKGRGRQSAIPAGEPAESPQVIGDSYGSGGGAYGGNGSSDADSRVRYEHSTPPLSVLSSDGCDPLHEDASAQIEGGIPEAHDELRIQEDIEGNTRRLSLIGQLDLNSAPLLQAEISRCHASGFKSILLDLSRLDFIDSTGLWVITTARRWCETHGCGFMLIPGSEPVQSVFELTGLSDVLPFITAEPSAQPAARHTN